MSKIIEWDYALKLRGITPKSLPMADLAQYLKEFAALLGAESKPVFTGLVKGSAVLRSSVTHSHPALVRQRLTQAANDPDSQGASNYRKLEDLINQHGLSAEIIDSKKIVVINFNKTAAKPTAAEVIIQDTAQLDGQVVYVVGQDDTVNVRLLDVGGRIHPVTVTNLQIAQELAKRFRGGIVRIHVHGTWKRSVDGAWEIHKVYADSIEDLEESNPLTVMTALRAVPNNGWNTLPDPVREWEDLRGVHDLHA
jgi:hypothetical protein